MQRTKPPEKTATYHKGKKKKSLAQIGGRTLSTQQSGKEIGPNTPGRTGWEKFLRFTGSERERKKELAKKNHWRDEE